MTALAGDPGAGIFDGANSLRASSPSSANTYWTKAYNVYSKVDTGWPLSEFETWWGNPALAERRRDAVDRRQSVCRQQAVHRQIAPPGTADRSAQHQVADRLFCSWGDNITPPQQALDWILDLYDDVSEIVSNGQTIIYSIHQSIGHLGIFVSGKVAAKEHRESSLASI